MKSTDIHKSEWLPLYDSVPFKEKRNIFTRMGFDNSASLLSKQYIKVEQYHVLLDVCQNNSTVGVGVDYDHEQCVHFNKELLNLIRHPDFKLYKQHNRTKVVNEQMRLQIQINKNK